MWPYKLCETKRVQFEISNFCNLLCPSCARENRKKKNLDINNKFLSAKIIKEKFKPEDLPNLEKIRFCGNIDEPTMHPDLEEILIYFCSNWPFAEITISTNGCTRNINFWKRLGEISAKYPNYSTTFAIDGLKDTNHIYRIKSNWEKIDKNIKSYFSVNGAKAIWQFVVFSHNEHQIIEIQNKAKEYGFSNVLLRYSGRKTLDSLNSFTKKYVKESLEVVCRAQFTIQTLAPNIFVSYTGDVSPCCFQDLNHFHVNKEIGEDIKKHNFKTNIHNSSLLEIVEGEFFNFMNENIKKNTTCNIHCKNNQVDYFKHIK